MTPGQLRKQAAAYRAWQRGQDYPIIDPVGVDWDPAKLPAKFVKDWKGGKVHDAHVAKGVARADQSNGQ